MELRDWSSDVCSSDLCQSLKRSGLSCRSTRQNFSARMRSFRPKITRSPICAGVLRALTTAWKASVCRNLGRNSMVVHCVNFGSLWWLRPGNHTSDPLRFSSHAAVFNTTGFVSGSRERRLWHIAGVIRINLGMHRDTDDARRFEAARYECIGLERRGEWNRLLLDRKSVV